MKRRDFLKGASAALTTSLFTGAVKGANDRISVGVIGMGRMGMGNLGVAMKRPFTLSNEKDPKVKCEVIEKPLPVCGH